MTSMLIDLAIVFLLLVTLGAGYRLHKRLQLFRADTEAFEPLIEALDKAATRAQSVLADFRKITDEVGTKLTKEADDTQRLLDELDFMTKRADQLADRLDKAISGARHLKENAVTPPAAAVAHPPSEPLAATPQEQRRRAPDLEKRLKTLR